jgi:hypothetical protein
MMLCFTDVGVKDNRRLLLCKKSGRGAEIRALAAAGSVLRRNCFALLRTGGMGVQ